jgi:hypothetical protein
MIVSGVNHQIEEGLKAQINFYQGAIKEVSYTLHVTHYTYPTAATIATTMLDISVKLCDAILITIDTMTTEHAARRGKPDESWLQICAIVHQVFRELRKVLKKGAGSFNSSATRVVGHSWWYVLQTHLQIAEFSATEFRRYSDITPVFTIHLNRFRVTKSVHTALKTSYKVLKTQVRVLDASVKRLQDARGNHGGRGDTTSP